MGGIAQEQKNYLREEEKKNRYVIREIRMRKASLGDPGDHNRRRSFTAPNGRHNEAKKGNGRIRTGGKKSQYRAQQKRGLT